MMMVDSIVNNDFVGFKNAVTSNIKGKVANHPRVSAKQQEISKLNKINSLFKEINSMS